MQSKKNFTYIAATLLCLIVLASASFAATNPLSLPRGLAVDASGNLWVANAGTNSILAFSPTYKQLTSETITANVSEPTDVAFDSLGNLWVANFFPASVTEYTNSVQDTNATLNTDIPAPGAIAVDGLNNVWIASNVNNEGSIAVYQPSAVYGPANHLQDSFGPYAAPFYGIKVASGNLVWGNGAALNFAPASSTLTSGAIDGVPVGGTNTATYLAAAANGTIYFATTSNTINYAIPAAYGEAFLFLELSFSPTGIAVDSVRGRIYVANGSGDSISVYSTDGKLLHTIK
ncbi:MAG: hypothetical protein WBX02_08785 [Terriglobales bacterium]